ncbi:MAG: CdaR family protein [bacterium]
MDRTRLTKNLGLKAGSLIVAFLLWFHIATEGAGYERVLEIPLQVSGVPEGMVVSREVPGSVLVRFRGQGKRLLTLPWREARLVVDASGIRVMDSRVLDVGSILYDESPELQAVEVVRPQMVTIELDRLAEREVPVDIRVRVRPDPGHTLVGRMRAVPGSVRVSGPATEVRALSSIPTDSLSLSRVREPVEREVPLSIPDIHNVEVDPPRVTVTGDVQQLGERTFQEVPVRVRGPKEGRYLAQPRTATVTVSGGSRLLEDLTKEQVRLILDVGSEPPDGLTPVEPTVELPPGLTLLRLDPPRFRVTEY